MKELPTNTEVEMAVGEITHMNPILTTDTHSLRRAQHRATNERWVEAFEAYHKALSEPYFDQDDESRQSNRQEVERTFDALKALAEGVR